MELGAQIKKYRMELSISQDELAEKVYVSRQSISNWETGKTYPDIKSLLLLSEVFSVSLDKLIKGDVENMRKEINEQEMTTFQKDSSIFAVLFLLTLILPIPLVKLIGTWGLAVFGVLFIVTMYYAIRVEKHKKKHDIHTYKEIMAFMDGVSLDEIEKARESGKRPYQNVLKPILGALAGILVAVAMLGLFELFDMLL